MKSLDSLKPILSGLNGKDYGAYQVLKGSYQSVFFQLHIDQIPKDPYAPSFTGIYRASIPHSFCFIPPDMCSHNTRKKAYCDFLARRFYRESFALTAKRGTGNSGLITIDKPGQAILERNSVIFSDHCIELRFFIGLPADGRNIAGKIAEKMLLEELPAIIDKSLNKIHMNELICLEHIKTAETADYLRSQLQSIKLCCFIGENSLLPRVSGISDEPENREKVIPFNSPPSLLVSMNLPDGSKLKGLGIPEGITLITGGGYHGKSTLLEAISSGIYNHIPGDGRERIVSKSNTLKLRSYSGRFVEKVNISSFISNLPGGQDTNAFSTENASGSTSLAAALIEAVEMGTEVLLMDEDTCASNFMIRDEKMQRLVQKSDEPITPFIDRAVELFRNKGLSTILVLGGSGDYFEIADLVIQMKNYNPINVTADALKIAGDSTHGRHKEGGDCLFDLSPRIPLPQSINPYNDYGKIRTYAKEIHRINFGNFIIDLTDVEQLLELSQSKAIMEALKVIQN
jgi:predicted ABC-class ATPase